MQIPICVFFGLLALAGTALGEEITVKVEAADPEAKTLTLEGGKVVSVTKGDADIGYVGTTIRGDLDTSTDPAKLNYIWPADSRSTIIAEGINKQLHNDTVTRGRKAIRSVGDPIPDFALYNEQGELTTARSLRGKNLVINFIFTRCAVPTMCPASMARMTRLQEDMKDAGLTNVELVTVTFDPEFDTPGILNEYATLRGIDLENYTLLTGNPDAIKDLMKQFGILVMASDGTLNHTMSTLIINEEGEIIYRKDGSRWSTQDFLERLAKMEGKDLG